MPTTRWNAPWAGTTNFKTNCKCRSRRRAGQLVGRHRWELASRSSAWQPRMTACLRYSYSSGSESPDLRCHSYSLRVMRQTSKLARPLPIGTIGWHVATTTDGGPAHRPDLLTSQHRSGHEVEQRRIPQRVPERRSWPENRVRATSSSHGRKMRVRA